jgi:GNAT superfamily N-acetyltransferase
MSLFSIRKAAADDISIIKQFIIDLAIYEKMLDEVVVTDELLHHSLFVDNSAHCILAFEENKPVGFALYFYNYSTFLGKKGLYLEDLFVNPTYRGKGYGKQLLLHLVQLATQQNCGRMEWSVLNWNTPAIEFYESLGAEAMNIWTVFRLNESKLKQLANTTSTSV